MARIPTPLSPETINSLSTANAPKPEQNVDKNIGKEAYVTDGAYANIRGILFPPYEGIRYIIENDLSFLGNHFDSGKRYLLMFFYNTGELFCAIEADYEEIQVPSGKEPLPNGSGTINDPFGCGTLVCFPNGYENKGETVTTYVDLGDTSGMVSIQATIPKNSNFKIKVYYVDVDGSIVVDKILSTSVSSQSLNTTFYFDEVFSANRIKIEFSYSTSYSLNSAPCLTVYCPSGLPTGLNHGDSSFNSYTGVDKEFTYLYQFYVRRQAILEFTCENETTFRIIDNSTEDVLFEFTGVWDKSEEEAKSFSFMAEINKIYRLFIDGSNYKYKLSSPYS